MHSRLRLQGQRRGTEAGWPVPSHSLYFRWVALPVLFGYDHCHWLVLSAPPIRGIAVGFVLSEWKCLFPEKRFSLVAKSIHWLFGKPKLQGALKECSPCYLKGYFLNSRTRGKGLTPHTQDSWQPLLKEISV